LRSYKFIALIAHIAAMASAALPNASMPPSRAVVDEVSALEATAQALEAARTMLQNIRVGGPRGSSAADQMDDSDSDGPEHVRQPRARSSSMKRVQASAFRASSVRHRNDRAILAELASAPHDPRLPPPQSNVERLRTDDERAEAMDLVATCVEQKSQALAARLRARTASDAETMQAVLDVLAAAEYNILRMAELTRASYQHVVQRVLSEMVSCDQRAASLSEPGFTNPASVPNTSLATATPSNPVPTGDGSDYDSSAPNTPRGSSTCSDDESGSTSDLSSSWILASAKSYRRNAALGTESDIDI
jgi:hypothetical protein